MAWMDAAGQDLAATTGEKAPLVERETDQAPCLGVVDHVTHLGDILAVSDGDDRKPADLRGRHEQLHRLPRVAMTPPPRRRRRAITKIATATNTTMTTTINQPTALTHAILNAVISFVPRPLRSCAASKRGRTVNSPRKSRGE